MFNNLKKTISQETDSNEERIKLKLPTEDAPLAALPCGVQKQTT